MKKVIFIGPLPPPIGGVAIINQSFQALDYKGYSNLTFNTSNNKLREDLYSGLPWQNISKELKKIKSLKRFIKKHNPVVANVFVTSGHAIIRDLFYLRLLYKNNIPVIVHFHSKTKGEFSLTKKRLKLVAKYFQKYANKIMLLSDTHLDYFTRYFDITQCEVIEKLCRLWEFLKQDRRQNQDLFICGKVIS